MTREGAVAGLLTNVRWEWDGADLAADAAAGATVLTVTDPDPYTVDDKIWVEETGPYLITAIDEDAFTLTIYPGLTEAVEDGAPVAPDVGGEGGRVWLANVVIPDSDLPIDVPLVFHDLLGLSEGEYNPPKLITLTADYDSVVDVPGSTPSFDAGFLDPSTLVPDVTNSWGVVVQDELDALAGQIATDIAALSDEMDAADQALTNKINDAIDDLTGDINDVRTSANGKNTNYYQTEMPTGGTYVVGDNWFDTDNEYALSRWSGSAWVPAPLGDAAIATLDAGKIVTGFLDTARLQASSILTSKLVVADFDNLAEAGDFEDASLRAAYPATQGWNYGTVTHNGGTWGVSILNPTTANALMVIGPRSTVRAGEVFNLQGWAVRTATATTSAVIGLAFYDGSGANISTQYVSAPAGSGASGWTELSSNVTAPANSVTAIPVLRWNGPAGAGGYAFSSVRVRRATSAELLVDGAVTARTFNGTSFTGVVMTAGIFQTHAAGGPIFGGGIDPNPPRGIKIVSSDKGGYGSLITYDPTGVATLVIDGSTGSIVMKGSLTAGSTISGASFFTSTGSYDIEIIPGNPSALNFKVASSSVNNTDPAGMRAAIAVTNILGANTISSTLTLRGFRTTLNGMRPRIDVTSHFRGAVNQGDLGYHAGGADDGGVYGGSHFFYCKSAARVVIAEDGIHMVTTTSRLSSEEFNGSSNQNAIWNSLGQLVRATSSRRYKHDIRPLTLEQALPVLGIEPVTFRWNEDQGLGSAVQPGFIAEQAQEAGASLWVQHHPETGVPDGVKYPEMAAAHNLMIKDIYERLIALEEAND